MTYNIEKKDILPLIESTLLRPDVLEADLTKLCEDAKKYAFSAICVHPVHIKACKKILKSASEKSSVSYKVNVNTVVSYPLGGDRLPVKIKAIKDAFKEGADHVDVVVNIALIKSAKWEHFSKECAKLVKAGGTKHTVKLVLCTEYLTREEIDRALEIAIGARARFIRTSTEFNEQPIDLGLLSFMDERITHWFRTRGDDMKPCALAVSGARNFDDAANFVAAKAQKISTTNALRIAETEPQAKNQPETNVNSKIKDDFWEKEVIEVELACEDEEEEAKEEVNQPNQEAEEKEGEEE